jgi:hypothetical protein
VPRPTHQVRAAPESLVPPELGFQQRICFHECLSVCVQPFIQLHTVEGKFCPY